MLDRFVNTNKNSLIEIIKKQFPAYTQDVKLRQFIDYEGGYPYHGFYGELCLKLLNHNCS